MDRGRACGSPTVGAWLAACALLLAGCGDDDPTGVTWGVSGFPVTAHFGDACLSRSGGIDGAAAEAAPWAVGTSLAVGWSWDRPCGGWFGEPCSDLWEERVEPTQTDVWRAIEPRPPISGLAIESVGAGLGHVGARANGRDFDPLDLRAVAPATLAVRTGWGDGTGTPSDAATLTLAAGARETIVVVARGADATELCGSVALDVRVESPVITVTVLGSSGGDREITPRTSFPMVVEAGASSGSTRVTFTAGGVAAVLDVSVGAP